MPKPVGRSLTDFIGDMRVFGALCLILSEVNSNTDLTISWMLPRLMDLGLPPMGNRSEVDSLGMGNGE
jgi:hypothetical protein